MFEKKQETTISDASINVQTMPADFYGGVNPVVKFKKVEKEVAFGSASQKLSSSEKKILDKETSAGGIKVLHPANFLASRKGLLILGGSLFLLFIAGASVYYWLQTRQPAQNIAVSIPTASETNNTPVIEAPTTSEQQAVETPTTTLASATEPKSLAEAPLEFPSVFLGDSADLDKDGLTDVAEELFVTDPSKPDTDGDNYNDGHEVFYLYDPAVKEPSRLIDSGNVIDYANPGFGYSIYYPKSWAFGDVDGTARDILVSTITGENIEVRVFDKDVSQSFADWFAVWAPDQKYSDLVDFESYYKEKGLARNDSLAYYFYNDNHVYVILYHTTDSNVVNYRSIITMMARSFRSPENNGSEVQSQPEESNLTQEINNAEVVSSTPESPATSTGI